MSESFLIKLQSWGSGTGVFLWILSLGSSSKVFPGSQVRLCSSYLGFSWPYSICLFLRFNDFMLHYRLHCSSFISVPSVHTLLIMFYFYFLQFTVHLIHFNYHSPSRSNLPYLVVFISHGHMSFSLSSQSRLWKLTPWVFLDKFFILDRYSLLEAGTPVVLLLLVSLY